MTDKTSDSSSAPTLSQLIVDAIQNKKGTGISIVDMRNIPSAPATEFIICEGRSTSQVTAIADNIREEVQRRSGRKPFNYDGYRNAQWIAIDYGDTMIHVFLPDVRAHYNLEELWYDAKITRLPDLD